MACIKTANNEVKRAVRGWQMPVSDNAIAKPVITGAIATPHVGGREAIIQA